MDSRVVVRLVEFVPTLHSPSIMYVGEKHITWGKKSTSCVKTASIRPKNKKVGGASNWDEKAEDDPYGHIGFMMQRLLLFLLLLLYKREGMPPSCS